VPGHNPDNLSCSNMGLRGEAHDELVNRAGPEPDGRICPGCLKPVVGPAPDLSTQRVTLTNGTTWHVNCALLRGKLEVQADHGGRPSWDDTMLSIAQVMSQRSTCLRLQAGAVVATADHKVVATGYNGAPHGLEHCTVMGCMIEGGHCVRAVHAEVNAVVQVARLGGPGLDGCTLYSTHRSCVRCAPILVQSGIRRVVYSKEYDSDLASGAVVDLLTRSGVQVEVRRDR
jgi:dCMP deaminase